jgi:membrane-bound lytic murein transglycosylase B
METHIMKNILIITRKFLLLFIFIFGYLAFFCNQTIYASSKNLSSYPVVQTFINTMVQHYQFNANELVALFDSTPLIADVIPSMQHPYEEKPWYIYQSRLVTQQRITLGVDYWHRHAKALHYAEKKYGVPASIIVAIVGIESLYGQAHLKYPVLNTLITLSFAYPPRAIFFQKELMHYLLLTRELNVDPRTIYGSYAGAIGLPQFMPSSYRHFAISYQPNITTRNNDEEDENNELGDLVSDSDDVVVSVANYLSHFGWQKGEKITIPANIYSNKYQELLPIKSKATYTVAKLKQYGIKPIYKLEKNTKVSLVQLQNKDASEYWLGLNNFHVLSHYNADKQYIMAVYQLAIAIKHAM